MLLYLRSAVFPTRTFVVQATGEDSIAMVKARLLHMLAEVGSADTYFRLFRSGRELKDNCTVVEVGLSDGVMLDAVSADNMRMPGLGRAVERERAVLRSRTSLRFMLRFVVTLQAITTFMILFALWGWLSLLVAMVPYAGNRLIG